MQEWRRTEARRRILEAISEKELFETVPVRRAVAAFSLLFRTPLLHFLGASEENRGIVYYCG